MSQKAYFDSKELKKFLDKDVPICREERQFALLLYNVFLEKKRGSANDNENKIVKKCLFEEKENVDIEKICIIDVYFEATLMRDYFNACKDDKEKDEFNKRLLEFCLGDNQENVVKKLKEKLRYKKDDHEKDKIWQNLGQSTVKKAINEVAPLINLQQKACNEVAFLIKLKQKACLQIASMMMNVTPDLLVIYKYDDKLCAKALECKYLSNEGRYTDVVGSKIQMQYFIQECIMKFCFGTCENSENIEKHIPECPTKGIWKNNKNLWKIWKNFCKEVYENILLEQESDYNGLEDRIYNCGVGVIRFELQEDKKEPESEIQDIEDEEEKASEIRISVKDLLANRYHNL